MFNFLMIIFKVFQQAKLLRKPKMPPSVPHPLKLNGCVSIYFESKKKEGKLHCQEVLIDSWQNIFNITPFYIVFTSPLLRNMQLGVHDQRQKLFSYTNILL